MTQPITVNSRWLGKRFPSKSSSPAAPLASVLYCGQFTEAVHDGVVLDLRYEARDIDQYITAPEKIDKWFGAEDRRADRRGEG